MPIPSWGGRGAPTEVVAERKGKASPPCPCAGDVCSGERGRRGEGEEGVAGGRMHWVPSVPLRPPFPYP